MIYRDIDDSSGPVLTHVRDHCPGHQEDTVDVRVNHHPPHIRVGFPERLRLRHETPVDEFHPPGGIVDKDVDSTEL